MKLESLSASLVGADPLGVVRAASALPLGRVLANQAKIRPSAVAVADSTRELTYQELNASANRVANGFLARGLRRGDRIAVLSENSVEFALVLCGAAKIGVAVAALNWRFHASEIRHSIDLVSPSLLLSSRQQAGLMAAACELMGGTPPLVYLDPGSNGSGDSGEPAVEVDGEDIATILCTSGTTGRPKAAAISHRAMVARAMVVSFDLGIGAGDTYVGWPPMFHMTGTDFFFITCILGGKFVVLPGFSPEAIVELMATETIGWLVLMPGTFDQVIELLARDARPVRGVKVVGGLADLVAPEKIAALSGFIGAPFYNSFGCTEAGALPGAGLLPPGEVPTDLAKHQSSLCDIKLVDESGEEVVDGEPGELLVRGPTVFSGYWNDPGATLEVFRDGWLHTGDVMRREENGRLTFCSRSKYLIKSGGENVYPAEVERVLIGHPDVEEAVVVRQADDRWGEVPVAVVARREDAASADELIEYCRLRIAHYKVPSRVVFLGIGDFPRNVTGKIVREELEGHLLMGREK